MTGEELPRARVRRRRLFNLAWLVPLAAVVIAGFLMWERLRERGPEIVVSFTDGGGLRVGLTPVKYRGVAIGEVTGISLSEDHKRVLVRTRLVRSAAGIAREGTTFWIVRPQVGFGNITGLGTVLTGPEIHALPGKGEGRIKEFVGLDSAPVALETEGLKLILRAERPRSIRPNTPVQYRGVEVGVVQKLELGPNSTSADVHVLIFERYAGHEIKIEMASGIAGRKRFRGELLGTEGGAAKLRYQTHDAATETVLLPFDDIAEAKLVLTDALIAQALKRSKQAARNEPQATAAEGRV